MWVWVWVWVCVVRVAVDGALILQAVNWISDPCSCVGHMPGMSRDRVRHLLVFAGSPPRSHLHAVKLLCVSPAA